MIMHNIFRYWMDRRDILPDGENLEDDNAKKIGWSSRVSKMQQMHNVLA